jgi:hypothetical protein
VKLPAVARSSVPCFVALLVSCLVIACGDGDLWDYEGVGQVCVETMEAPDTLHAADTLTVILEGTVPGYGNACFSHVDTERDSFRVGFTVWADCYSWSGSGPMPPLPIWVRCEPEVLPPFCPGRLLLFAYHQDSTTVSDTVLVVP